MSGFQKILDRINRKYGAVGSVGVTLFWLVVMTYALVTILGDFL